MSDTIGKGSLRDKSDEALIAEWRHWNEKITNATSWGAALAAADSFRKSCQREIDRRGLQVPE